MNTLKHMEAAFVIALSVAGIGSYLAATSQPAYASPVQRAAVASQTGHAMAVVTVVARRLTPAEKAQSLRDEAAATAMASR